MSASHGYDAVVVGSGPNGLAAAVTLARAKCRVLVLEAAEGIGGGARSEAMTLPGFVHDHCSAVFPLGVGSPFFRSLNLAPHGLEWVHPPVPLAHPLEDGTAAVLERSVEATAGGLGADGEAYAALFGPLVSRWEDLLEDVLAPVHWPRHPLLLARFGLDAVRSARGLADRRFRETPARALFAGLAAHSFLALEHPVSAAFGLVLGLLGHAVGWPMARGGAGRITAALAAELGALNGTIETGRRVTALGELPAARIVILDVSPRQMVALCRPWLPARYRRRLERFQYGPAAFKVDWALDAPIPWTAPVCARAGTVHVGGALEEVAAAEAAVARGEVPERPFVLLAQPSRYDSSRAPDGQHTAWAYCHVPSGCGVDMTRRIEEQVERFAPGFRRHILARRATSPADFEQANANLVGGDIGGGSQTPWQLLARPVLSRCPYATPVRGVYLGSASTPPGGGVHGMCGYHAARAALERE